MGRSSRLLFMATVIGLALAAAACSGGDSPTAPSSGSGEPDSGGASTGGTSAGVQLTADFGGRALFPADNWWNQDVSSAPIDPQSDAYIDYIGRARTSHPDFGPPPYGIPYVAVGGTEARRVCDLRRLRKRK